MPALYDQYVEDDLKKEVLIEDPDFLVDASSFLAKRKGLDVVDPEDVYEQYIEHMRKSDVNELDTIGDLMYAQEASDEDKEEMRRLYDTWDRMPIDLTDDIGGKIADYGSGILTAPSTYVGIATGGTGKLGAVAAQQAAKVATKEIIKRGALSAATKTMLVEGGIGAVQGGISEGVRVEVSPDREFTGEGVLVGGIAGAIPGIVTGGTTGYITTRQAIKANELKVQAEKVVAEKIAKAESTADEVISSNKETANVVEGVLRPLDSDMVARGEASRELLPAEMVVARLDDSVRKRLIGAVTELAGDLRPKDGERITETIVRSLRNSPDAEAKLADVFEKYDISSEQFFDVFAADASNAGRTLGEVGQISKLIDNAMIIANDAGVQVERDALENVVNEGPYLRALKDTASGAERMRRAILTSQIQTTVRNFVGGGARVFTDIIENAVEDKTAKFLKTLGFNYTRQDFRPDSLAIAKYLFNQEEAELVVNMYRRNNPKAADRIFQTFIDATDLSQKVKSGTRMEAFGLKINFLNKMSDNYYKRAIFAGELQRLVKAKYNKNVVDMLADGTFSKIDPKLFDTAGNKAFEMLYQLTPDGKGDGLFGWLGATARGYLNKVDTVPGLNMVTGAIMPFPRFVINQIKFMYDHAPVLGLMNITAETAPKKVAQQVTGLSMVMGAMAMRAQEGTDMEWYQVLDDEGNRIDLRPLLGPFNMFMYMGDTLYRYRTGQKIQDKWVADAIEIGVGSSARGGTGQYLLEKFGPEATAALEGEAEWTEKSKKMFSRMAGDYAATLTYAMPLAVARDLFKLSDEEARLIPETNGQVEAVDIFMMRATRALPEPVRQYLVGDKERRYGITTPHPTRSQDPIGTMVTGAGKQAPATDLEKELARLKMDSYDLYKPIPFGPADVIVREAVSQKLPQLASELIRTDRYKGAVNDSERRLMIKELKTMVISPERQKAFDLMRARAETGELELEEKFGVDQISKFEFESLDSDLRNTIAGRFEQIKGRSLGGDAYVKGDYTYAVKELQREVKESTKVSKFAEGGMVADPMSLSETAEEMDPVARKEAGDSYVDEMISLGLDMAPVTGEIRSAQSALEDFEEGNYGMAALGAIGAVPGIGMVARAGTKGVKALKKGANIYDDLGTTPDTFEDAKKAWLERTGKTPNTEVTERNKIMQNAANQVKEGKLDIEEFRKIADKHKPVKVWDDVPEMATYEDMFFALDAKKRQSPFVGYNARIPEGTRMTSRLDIPAYTSSDTWVVTLKGDYNDGKNMYAPAVRLKNVDLNQSLKNQEKALGVAAGKAKGPFAVMEGDYVEETAEDTYRLAQEALESGEWTQVGYDPTRRGFFYDRETMEPVLGAEEILQVGPMVLAKKATKGDPKDFKFNSGGLMSRK